MSQFGAQKNPPWVRTTGQGVSPASGHVPQLQALITASHSIGPSSVSFQQQQMPQLSQQHSAQSQQVYQPGIGMQSQQQQQQPPPQAGIISQQIQLDKNKTYLTMSYPFSSAVSSSLGNIRSSTVPLLSMQNTLAPSTQSPITYPAPRSLQQAAGFTSQPPPLNSVLPTVAAASTLPSPGSSTSASSAPLQPKQRVFTGTITKLHDNFGFIDGDVFFQTSACIKGLPPKVGERTLVHATYNAGMPFKWNASRVEVLPPEAVHQNLADGQNLPSAGPCYNAVPPPVFTSAEAAPSLVPQHERPRNHEQHDHKSRERRRSKERERESERDRRRDEKLKEREREREKDVRSRSPAVRRRSRSPRSKVSRSPPVRRRARIVPKYVVQVPKISLNLSESNVLELKRRYGNLYIPSDFFSAHFRWVDAFPANDPLKMNRTCSFHVFHKDVDEVKENNTVLEPSDADYTFSAKVMLLSLPTLREMYRKTCSLAEEMKDKDIRDGYVHPTRLINFLVGVRGKNETMAIGGPWSPSLDGPNPETNPSVLIKTAVRTCKALTGIDLGKCIKWYRFLEIYYRRGESTHKGKSIPSRVETVVIFLPDVWNCVHTRLEWEELQNSYRAQMQAKMPEIELASSLIKPEIPEDQEKERKQQSTSSYEKKIEQSLAQPTHHSRLDPKNLSMMSLKQELEARSLNSKGLKSQMVARLVKALKAEAELEAEESSSFPENVASGLSATTKKISKNTDLSVTIENDTLQREEKKKAEEKSKHEDRERQARERKYLLPETPHIVVHPSRTAKSGKFDCTVMSLSLLLDYRAEDTKEHSFEVSLFAELFNEMLMRDYGFRIYRSLVEAPNRRKENKSHKTKDSVKEKEIGLKTEEETKTYNEEETEADDGEQESKPKIEENEQEQTKATFKKDVKTAMEDESMGPEVEMEIDREQEHVNEDDEEDEEEEEVAEDASITSSTSKKPDSTDKDKITVTKDRDSRDKKGRDKPQLFTADPALLLSFVYFDQSHCGYIFDKDLEEILYTLGLGLSRAQCRRLMEKVVTRDTLNYRKLTDVPREDDSGVHVDEEHVLQTESQLREIAELAAGNRILFPTFSRERSETALSGDSGGLVMYNGELIDIAKLLHELEQNEKVRIETENVMVSIQNDLDSSTEYAQGLAEKARNLKNELQDCQSKLEETEDGLKIAEETSSKYFYGLMQVKAVVDPLLKGDDLQSEEPIETKAFYMNTNCTA